MAQLGLSGDETRLARSEEHSHNSSGKRGNGRRACCMECWKAEGEERGERMEGRKNGRKRKGCLAMRETGFKGNHEF